MDESCEEAHNLLRDDEKQVRYRSPKQQSSQKRLHLLALLLTNLATFIFAFKIGEIWEKQHGSNSIDGSLAPPNHSLYADMDRDSMHSINFSAFSLNPSPYTAPADPSVDQAWRELGVECKSRQVTTLSPALTLSPRPHISRSHFPRTRIRYIRRPRCDSRRRTRLA